MKIVDMYYGDRPVIAQYLGEKLVWQRGPTLKRGVIGEFKRSFMYIPDKMQLRMSTSKTIVSDGKTVPWEDILAIEFNGAVFEITGCEVSPQQKNVFFTLKDTQAEFERKSGWKAPKYIYFDIMTKFYGMTAGGLETVDRTKLRDNSAVLYWDSLFDFATYQTITRMKITTSLTSGINKPVTGVRMNGIDIEDYSTIVAENAFSIIIINFTSRSAMEQQWQLVTGTERHAKRTVSLEIDTE